MKAWNRTSGTLQNTEEFIISCEKCAAAYSGIFKVLYQHKKKCHVIAKLLLQCGIDGRRRFILHTYERLPSCNKELSMLQLVNIESKCQENIVIAWNGANVLNSKGYNMENKSCGECEIAGAPITLTVFTPKDKMQ